MSKDIRHTAAGTAYEIRRAYGWDDVPGRMGFYHVFVGQRHFPITEYQGCRYKRDIIAWAEENEAEIDGWGAME